jgi:chromate reductase
MSHPRNVAVIVGSLRKDSASRKIAKEIAARAPSNLRFDFLEIGALPFYDQDLETATPPAEWTAFREKIAAADAVLFVTPEYNRSIPGVVKNAIDVGSRPYGQAPLSGKPAAVVSTSAGGLGGFGANHHLRQTLVFLDMPTLMQPEAYIGNSLALFDENGQLVNEQTGQFLGEFVAAFADLIDRHAANAARKAA